MAQRLYECTVTCRMPCLSVRCTMHTSTAQSHARPHSHHHAGRSAAAAASAATAAKPKLYNPRHPERTLLYQTVAEHFETWHALASAGQFDGQGNHHTPRPFVRQAFRKYLECGIFAHGFARAWCGDCGQEEATAEDFSVVQNEGGRSVRRTLRHYSLDAIIAVGYRVSSKRATQFRIWATQILNEYIRKGFVLVDERLKQGKQVFGEDYFLELLERVRSIRASERRIYQQITDIFAECSVDYDPKSDITQNFYAMVQNKFHFAITGQTAEEIVHSKADHNAPHAGLLT